MEILRGAPALSEFRVHKLLQSCAQRGVEIADVYAEYVHFAELSSPLSPPERATLGQLLRYGPTIPEHTPSGQLFLVTPRPGTISPGLPKQPTSPTTADCTRSSGWSAALPITCRPRVS